MLPYLTCVSIRKRPVEAEDTDPPTVDQPESSKTARHYGRIYGRQDDPFTNVDTVVNFGIKYEIADESEESNDEPITLSIRYFFFSLSTFVNQYICIGITVSFVAGNFYVRSFPGFVRKCLHFLTNVPLGRLPVKRLFHFFQLQSTC